MSAARPPALAFVGLLGLGALPACQTIDEHAAPGTGGWGGTAGMDAGKTSPAPSGGDDAGAMGPATMDDGGGSALPDGAVPSAGPANVVTTGREHSCALSKAGAVLCWGANDHGQLGDGTTTASPVPVPVVGLASGVVAIAAGSDHACAALAQDAGTSVMCWGRNDQGQLGDGSTADRSSPVAVKGLPGAATALTAGAFHTCALGSGGVSCWGEGDWGQLGHGAMSGSPTAVAVTGLMAPTALTAGGMHTCALDGSAVRCWGDNSNGQLGVGGMPSSATPVTVSGLTGATAIAAGNAHTCASTGSGVMCWGYGQFGQLGNGMTSDSAIPVAVTGLGASPKGIGAGGQQSCALDGNGGAWCWGEDQSGQLGDNGSSDSAVPVAVMGVAAGASCISGGTAHTCAVIAGGVIQCWGWNVAGQLGNGSQSDSATPVEVAGF